MRPFFCERPGELQGYDYATGAYGEQCWFAEDLRIREHCDFGVFRNDSEWDNTSSGVLRCMVKMPIAKMSTHLTLPFFGSSR